VASSRRRALLGKLNLINFCMHLFIWAETLESQCTSVFPIQSHGKRNFQNLILGHALHSVQAEQFCSIFILNFLNFSF
jgi:hypothetical protein